MCNNPFNYQVSASGPGTSGNDRGRPAHFSKKLKTLFRPTILIVEDQAIVRELLEVTFEENYQVVLAESGESALEMLPFFEPDLVIADIRLGAGLTGLDVCRAIRNTPPFEKVPVLILSGADRDGSERAARYCGANGYVPKPYSPLKLLEYVETLLGQGEGC